MEKELTDNLSSEILKALKAISGISVFLLDTGFNVVWSNTLQFCPLQHVEKSEGSYCYRVIRGQDGRCHQVCPVDLKAKPDRAFYMEQADDNESMYHVTVTRRYNDEGEMIGYLVIQKDVTQHAAEEARRHLESSREYFSHLASGMAHEINNPLTVLSGLLQEHVQDRNLSPDLQRDYRTMVKACNRIQEFVKYLLSFSYEEDRHGPARDVRSLLRRIMTFFQEFFRIRNLNIVLDIQGECPALAMTTAIFEKIAFNLVHYVADAVAPGGTITIRVPANQPAHFLLMELSSSDFMTIPVQLENIFRSFGRNDDMDAIHTLGMNTVHKLLKDNHGNIRLERTAEHELHIRIEIPHARHFDAGDTLTPGTANSH